MKKYQTIYADPQWKQHSEGVNLHIKNSPTKQLPYPTMSVADIGALNVASISADNAVLFLWTTNGHIEDAYYVARQWKFKPSTLLVWCKKPKGRGLGETFGLSTEYLLFARRGSLKERERHWSTWFEAPRREHSRKPEVARDIISKCFDGSKLELFARQRTLGWDCWGNEVESDIEL